MGNTSPDISQTLTTNSLNDLSVRSALVISRVRWYALYVRSRFEKKIDNALQEKRIECFLPMITEIHKWSDRKVRISKLLFQGYIFIRTDLHDQFDILEIPGAVYFVGIHGKLSQIPEEQINWLKILMLHPEVIHQENTLMVGERVRVIAGPFAGMEGTVVRVKGSTRLAISIDAIQQFVTIDIAPELLQCISSNLLVSISQ
jgi:transcription antitermination factor NusG